MMKKYSTDQTKFSTEQPLFEPIGAYPEPEFLATNVKPPLLKRRKVVIGLIALVTLIVMLGLFIINLMIENNKKVTKPEPSPTIDNPNAVEVTPLLKRVEAAREELKEADPTKNELVFPALDYAVRIDPKSR